MSTPDRLSRWIQNEFGPRMCVEWMSDAYCANLGITEEEKRSFLEREQIRAIHEAEAWLHRKLEVVRGKSIADIPRGSYCYTTVEVPGLPTEAELWERIMAGNLEMTDDEFRWVTVLKIRKCPYQVCADYGVYRCEFLEEQAVGIGEEDYTLALAYFGSEEELERQCNGSFLLGDAVRCCNRVVDYLEAQNTHLPEGGLDGQEDSP